MKNRQQPKVNAQIILFHRYGSAQALLDAFGSNFLYVSSTRRNGMPGCPLQKPAYFKKTTYRKWLWGQIQRGNERVINTLRVIDEKTVLVDDQYPSGQTAEVVARAAYYVQNKMQFAKAAR